MKSIMKYVGAILIIAVMSSCQLIDNFARIGTSVAVATGAMDEERAAEINAQAETLVKSFQDITPEQEYYIGRSVAAVILDEYTPFEDEAANRYINVVGQTVTMASDRPITFGGYHFLVLDSKEINGLAAPGGLIFLSRGLLNLARTEDELAAILAHEIAHVELRHGLQAIQKSRITNALTDIAVSAAENSRNERLAAISSEFGASVKDITSAIVNIGYSKAFEKEADISALNMLMSLGYDPAALIRVLRRMSIRLFFSRAGFAKTHPRPSTRINAIRSEISGFEPNEPPKPRRARFRKAMKAI